MAATVRRSKSLEIITLLLDLTVPLNKEAGNIVPYLERAAFKRINGFLGFHPWNK
jgi:hypothetical protein